MERDLMRNDDPLWDMVEAKKESFIELANSVWGTPELLYKEHKSAAAHKALLEAEGFRVTDKLAGIETAMMGEASSGEPIIAILGE